MLAARKNGQIAMSNSTPGRVSARFNYLIPSTASSLYRNGKVFLRRDADGNDSELTGVEMNASDHPLIDARSLPAGAAPELQRNGFELLDAPPFEPELDFFDQHAVITRYYPDCVRIVEQTTGGKAFAFDHNLRSAPDKQGGRRIKGGQQVQEPIQMVHGDYTLTSGPQRLRDLSKPPSGNDTLKHFLRDNEALVAPDVAEAALAAGGRFALINLWRNISAEPVAKHPLALCDGRSVEPTDLVVFELHYVDRIGENYFAKSSDRHRWHYYPHMNRDEALLIKQWDSQGTLARSQGRDPDGSDPEAPCTFSFHTAIESPSQPADAPERQSIEVRCVVIYS